MNLGHTGPTREIDGPVGRLEALLDNPHAELPLDSESTPRAVVVFAHPHPQQGGTMHSKIVYRGAKALSAMGCAVLRFNFRGVGRSAGTFDEGQGELADYLAALDYAEKQYPGLPLYAAGYSFGAWIAMNAGATDPRVGVLLGIALPTQREMTAVITSEKPKFLIHGERDTLIPVKEMWRFYGKLSEPKELVVIDATDHLFDGKTREVGDAIIDLLEDFEL